jgi:hypothetical protein
MRKHELKTGSARRWSCKPSHPNQTKQTNQRSCRTTGLPYSVGFTVSFSVVSLIQLCGCTAVRVVLQKEIHLVWVWGVCRILFTTYLVDDATICTCIRKGMIQFWIFQTLVSLCEAKGKPSSSLPMARATQAFLDREFHGTCVILYTWFTVSHTCHEAIQLVNDMYTYININIWLLIYELYEYIYIFIDVSLYINLFL